MKNKFNLIFFFTSLLIEIFLIQFVILNTGGNIPLYIFIYFEIFLLFLLSVYLIKKNLISFRLPQYILDRASNFLNIKEDLSIPLFIILAGIVFRLTLFPTALTTSPDAYRYIWEGKVIINGYNPYKYAPASPELLHLHSADLPSKINFNEKEAIYPPASQFIFAAAYLISGENFYGLKIMYLLFEILTLIFLLKLLYLKNKNLNFIIIYAWLPLPLMEYFINSHIDVVGISFFIISIYFFEKEKYYRASVLFALSVLSKFFPLFILPLLVKKGLKKTVLAGAIVVLISVLFYLPFYTKDVNIFNFLLLYLERWEFNASVYYVLKNFLSSEAARIICAVSFIIVTVIIAYKYKDFTKAALGIMIAFIIFSSTVYPWYLGWVAVLSPVFTFYSVISFLLTSNLSNITPLSPIWTEYTYVLLAEYAAFFILLGIDFRRLFKGKL